MCSAVALFTYYVYMRNQNNSLRARDFGSFDDHNDDDDRSLNGIGNS